jgi:hypothetical protein
MRNQYSYTYSVLRYIHDVRCGEFVNVGVALYSSEARYLSAICRTTYGRLSKVFPDVNAEHFKSLMRYIQGQFEERGERLAGELLHTSASTVLEIAQSVLPSDDSSLQWSPVGSGRTDNPSQALEKLFNRMVMRYEEKSELPDRLDEDVWRHYSHRLRTI